jgi:two-component system, cell cycle sensor histidine kinase and response regulator CckA
VHRTSNGHLFPVEITASYLQFEEREYGFFVARDITERRQLEERASQSQRLEALGRLAGGVAHDFNNLLTGIIGNLSLAEIAASPDIAPLLSDADRAAERAAGLTRQLLAFARRAPASKKSVDLNEVVAEATSLVRETVDRRIDIIVDLKSGLPKIRGDDTQLSQVVMNLLVNARDAITECLNGVVNPGRRNDSFVIAVTTREVMIDPPETTLDGAVRSGPHVQLNIADNGAGMDTETREHIFEPFFTTKPAGKGTGLGLSTVHGIVQQHNGWLHVFSEPGLGATFRIYLPLCEELTAPDVHENSATPVAGGTETILIADDEDLVLTLGQRILEGYGYTVLTAGDGNQALNTFRERADEIDLVILDLSMPILSGREVMEQIQALSPHARMIIASGYSPDSDNAAATKNGARAYLQKPYQVADLAGVVRSVLDADS